MRGMQESMEERRVAEGREGDIVPIIKKENGEIVSDYRRVTQTAYRIYATMERPNG